MPTKEKQRLQKSVIYSKGRKKIKGSRIVRLIEFPSCSFLILLGCERPWPGSIDSAHLNPDLLKTDTAVTKVPFMFFFSLKNKAFINRHIFLMGDK